MRANGKRFFQLFKIAKLNIYELYLYFKFFKTQIFEKIILSFIHIHKSYISTIQKMCNKIELNIEFFKTILKNYY
jgi:hypothetical protein